MTLVDDITNVPRNFVVTITASVMSDTYKDLFSRTARARKEVESLLNSDPNTDGVYVRVSRIHSTVVDADDVKEPDEGIP